MGEIFSAKLLHDIGGPSGHEMDRPVHVGARADRAPQEIVVGAVGEEEGEEIREESRFRYHEYDIDVAKPLIIAE